jgi:hypothetical protein
MELWIMVVITGAFYLSGAVADTVIALRGLAKGVAVEGNTLLVWLAGTERPSLKDYILYDLGEVGVLSLGLIALWTSRPELVALSIGPYIGMGVKHWLAVRSWMKDGVGL